MNKIYMIGDSIMADCNINAYPQFGWGQILKLFLKEGYEILNFAYPGCSTKSFIEQNRFEFIKNNIDCNDILIVSFGNNDEKNDIFRHTDKDSSFLNNLKYFIDNANSAKIILATSPTRRMFKNGVCLDSHLGYPQSMAQWAKDNGFLCVDLNELTLKHYNKIGQNYTKKYHLHLKKNQYFNFPNGKTDNSHLSIQGALMVCHYFIKDLLFKDSFFNNVFYYKENI